MYSLIKMTFLGHTNVQIYRQASTMKRVLQSYQEYDSDNDSDGHHASGSVSNNSRDSVGGKRA